MPDALTYPPFTAAYAAIKSLFESGRPALGLPAICPPGYEIFLDDAPAEMSGECIIVQREDGATRRFGTFEQPIYAIPFCIHLFHGMETPEAEVENNVLAVHRLLFAAIPLPSAIFDSTNPATYTVFHQRLATPDLDVAPLDPNDEFTVDSVRDDGTGERHDIWRFTLICNGRG